MRVTAQIKIQYRDRVVERASCWELKNSINLSLVKIVYLSKFVETHGAMRDILTLSPAAKTAGTEGGVHGPFLHAP